MSKIISTLIAVFLLSSSGFSHLLLANETASHSASMAESDHQSWTQHSENGVFEVTLQSQNQNIEINEYLDWKLIIRTADGEPVSPVRVRIGGGMPMHGHGLPTQPQLGKHLGDGAYMLKGLLFSMNGSWVLELDIQSKTLTDSVKFELEVDYASHESHSQPAGHSGH